MKEQIGTSKEEYKKLFDITPDMICIAGSNGYFKYLNPAWERVLGFSLKELLSTPYLELLHPDDRDSTFKEIERQLKGGTTIEFENRYLCKDGTYKDFEWRASPSKGDTLYAVARDITERKQAEEKLKKQKLQLELTLRASKIGLWDWDLITDKVFFSPEWKKQIGYADEEISNNYFEWEKRVHPDDLEKAKSTIMEFIKDPYPNYENEFRLQHKNGSYRWILAKASLISDAHGKPIRMLGSHLDITERKTEEIIKEALIKTLQKTLGEIKTLRGIIPICMYCKKIRDDKGAWDILEEYIGKHSDADFSHGICPDCYKIQLEELERIKE